MNSRFTAQFGELVAKQDTFTRENALEKVRRSSMSFAKYFEPISEVSGEEGSNHRKSSRSKRLSLPSKKELN